MTATGEVKDEENHAEVDSSKETESFLPVPGIINKTDDTQIAGAGTQVCTKEPHDTQQDYKDVGFRTRLKIDLPFRRRFIHTLWLFWAFIGLGGMVGLMGPSFPDLRLIVDQELDSASWLFTIFSLGYLLGSLVGGILYDLFNKLLLIFFSVLVMAVTTGIVPWCQQYPLMLAVRFISGLGAGGLDTGGNADLMSIWDEEGRPYMQAMHFCFGFGGIISPLIVEPFLAKKQCVPVLDITTPDTLVNSSISSVTMTVFPDNTTGGENVSVFPDNTTAGDSVCVEEYGTTQVHYGYLILGILILTCAIPFLVMYVNIRRSKVAHEMTAPKANTRRPQSLPLPLKVFLLILLFAVMLTYCAVEDTFTGFLMTFLLNHLNWSKDTGSYATSLHWTAFAIGRFSGIFLIRIFKPVQLLFAFCIFLICSFIGLTAASFTYTIPLIWVFIPLAGFSMSIIFPCIFTWTEESILEVTGKISSMLLIAASSGLLLNPLFSGYLMDNFAPICFVYLLLGESVLCLLLLLVTYFTVSRHVTISKHDMEITIEPPIRMEPMTDI